MRVRAAQCSNIHKGRNKGSHSTCTICVNRALRAACANPVGAKKSKAEDDAHLELQFANRLHYYKHIEMAQNCAGHEPEVTYISIIIDFMDQAKTYVPHMPASQKVKDMAHQLNWRICGVRVNGVRDWLYVVDESLPGGGNAILTILFDVLDILFSEGHVKVAKTVNLFLQFGNCGENKNVIMFGMLVLWVYFAKKKRGVRLVVEVCFLIVGHTHEDIDQYFKLLSDLIRDVLLLTPNDFLGYLPRVARNGSKQPHVKYVDHLFDFKEWLGPRVDKHITGHQVPHNYLIQFDDDADTAIFQYKNMSPMRCGFRPRSSKALVAPGGSPRCRVSKTLIKFLSSQLAISTKKRTRKSCTKSVDLLDSRTLVVTVVVVTSLRCSLSG